jgi:hypothetical protein
LGRVGPKRKKKKVIWVLTTNTSTRGRKKLSVGQRLVVIMVINPYIIIIEQLSLKFYYIYIYIAVSISFYRFHITKGRK